MPNRPLLACALLATLANAAVSAAAEQPPIVASVDDAFIAHEPFSDVWSIGSAELELVVGFNPDRTLGLQRLSNPITGGAWDISPNADVSLAVAGERLSLSNGGGLTTLVSVSAQAEDRRVRLTFTFEHRLLRVRLARTYVCYPGSPTIETWTRIEAPPTGPPVPIGELAAWRITMPLATVKWLGGLSGGNGDGGEGEAFGMASRDLDPGERIEIGAEGRSTEHFVPFVLVDDGDSEFYGGIIWSGAWRLAFERAGDDERLTVAAFFPGLSPSVSPGRPIELPHAFFGLTSHSPTGESNALHQFIQNGIRSGRPFQPLVTYNTWFAYGSTIDQDALTDEIARAAALGIELFVVDAGWYVGAGTNGVYDFDTGLGTWLEDRDRFPDGLSALADQAHDAGMKFGLWVEPERASLDTVDQPDLVDESWLATRDGAYGNQGSAQICLAHPDAWLWVLDRLVTLIATVRPDYLKWDNNFWINCNRPDHGHGASDGSFAHVKALYQLLDEVRRRFPDLLIENVSGGGNRLDFGMLGYTDVAWMDDRTSPSAHVRHNIEGLSVAFPPAYLLSFVIDSEDEAIRGGSDMELVVRSRMPGVLGLTYRTSDFDDWLTDAVIREIQYYKLCRDIIARANATLLSAQAPVDTSSWDVLQELADDRLSALIFAFKADASDGRLTVKPRGLAADVTYEVRSFDLGVLGEASGDLLMTDGIELVHAGGSAAHILVLTAR